MDVGDSFSVRFSEAPVLSTVCSGWTGAAPLTGQSITLNGNGSGDDTLSAPSGNGTDDET